MREIRQDTARYGGQNAAARCREMHTWRYVEMYVEIARMHLVEGEAKEPCPDGVARGGDDDEQAVGGGEIAIRVRHAVAIEG